MPRSRSRVIAAVWSTRDSDCDLAVGIGATAQAGGLRHQGKWWDKPLACPGATRSAPPCPDFFTYRNAICGPVSKWKIFLRTRRDSNAQLCASVTARRVLRGVHAMCLRRLRRCGRARSCLLYQSARQWDTPSRCSLRALVYQRSGRWGNSA